MMTKQWNRCKDETFALLDVMQRTLVVSYGRFVTKYLSYLQGTSSPKRIFSSSSNA
jgi:hypothetical protein